MRSKLAPAPDADRANGVITIEILGMPIRMTSPERTLVDIIHRQNSEKLIQPAWRAFEDWLPSLNLREVVLHARHSGCMATRAKVGHLLRGLSDRLNLDESLFKKLGEPPRWRHSWSRTSPEIQDPYWNLLVPEKLFLTAKESPDLAIQVNPRYDRIRDVDPSGLVDPENRRAHIAERRSELNDMVALAGAGQHLHRALAEYFKDPKIESDDNWDPLESINRSIKDQPEPWNPEGLSWTSDEDEPSQEQAWKRDDCPLENLVPQDDLADQESSRHLASNAP